jgi:hypothetical protein
MVANAIAAGYLVLSLPFSATLVLRPQATGLRLLLVVCDMVNYSWSFLVYSSSHPMGRALNFVTRHCR